MYWPMVAVAAMGFLLYACDHATYSKITAIGANTHMEVVEGMDKLCQY